MSIDTKDMAHPDPTIGANEQPGQDLQSMADNWSTTERDTNPRNMAGPLHRRRTLSGLKKGAAAVLVAGATILAAKQGGIIPTGNPDNTPSPSGNTQLVEGSVPPETQQSVLRISEMKLNRLPTEHLKGNVAIKINKDKDFPAARTSSDVINAPTFNKILWSEIHVINGKPIDEAINSDGKKEIMLNNPLAIRNGWNPDTGQFDGLYIVALSDGNVPVFFSASQQTEGFVFVEPDDFGEMFEPVSPSDNALDYGKVTLQDTPTK